MTSPSKREVNRRLDGLVDTPDIDIAELWRADLEGEGEGNAAAWDRILGDHGAEGDI